MTGPIHFVIAAAVLAVATTLGGCYLQIDDRPAVNEGSTTRTTQEAALVGLFGVYGADWDPAASTVDLAQQSDLVVSGVFHEANNGRLTAYDDNPTGSPRSLVLGIADPTVVKGRLPKRSDGTVYVEIRPPRSVYGLGFSQAIPYGSRVVLYLTDANDGSGLTRISNWNAGRPAGQPLYQPVNPQGLIIQLRDHRRVAWLLDPHAAVDASLAQVLPGGAVILRTSSIRAGVGFG